MEENTEKRVDLTLFSEKIQELKDRIASVIVGQEQMVDLVLTAVLANGHVLIEGVPGVAKTLLARLVARLVDADFSRIQFTPDLMPSDVLGTECFLKTLQGLPIDFQSKYILWNKFEVSRLRKTNSTEKRLFNDYGIPFLQARIPYSPLNDCNTVIPASLKVNLNLGTYSVVKPYLQEMAAEIIKITNGK